MAGSIDYSTTVETIRATRAVQYFEVASSALLVYDYLLTFREEYTLLWPAKWSLGKVLFLLTRYLVFVDTSIVLYHGLGFNINVRTCEFVYHCTSWTFVIGIIIAEAILALRTAAVYSNDRKVIIILSICMAILSISGGTILTLYLNSLTFRPQPFPQFSGCFITNGKKSVILAGEYILVMAYETGIFLATFYKCMSLYGGGNASGNASQLVYVLYKDGLLYYLYLSILSIINVLVITKAPHAYATLIVLFQRVLHSILTGRVLLHIWGAATNKRWDETMSLDISSSHVLSSVVIANFGSSGESSRGTAISIV